MLGSKWNRWLLVGGMAASALTMACGDEEDDGGGQPTPVDGGGLADASTPLDAIAASQCNNNPLQPGTQVAICTLPSGGTGFQTCTGGVPTGVCNPPSIPEAGLQLPEAAVGQFFPEAGIQLPEAGLGGDAGACPSGFTCEDVTAALKAVGFMIPQALMVCSKPDKDPFIGLFDVQMPPKCTAETDCSAAGLSGPCSMLPTLGMRCTQPCSM